MVVWNKNFAGKRAGGMHGKYLSVCIDLKQYYQHRLAWLMMTGDDPDQEIDHIDTDKHNNKWDNLRLATLNQQRYNAGIRKNNTSGFKGVSWCEANQNWTAQICINYERIKLGSYATAEEAAEAYRQAAIRLHGEFVHPCVRDVITDSPKRIKRRRARSGYEGVYPDHSGGWNATIGRKYVGYFKTIEEAAAAREQALHGG